VDSTLEGLRKYQKQWAVPVNIGEFCLFKEYDLWEK
jgi:endoglucanase